jgi:hypothetical protein
VLPWAHLQRNFTLLHEASMRGAADVVRALLDARAEVDSRDQVPPSLLLPPLLLPIYPNLCLASSRSARRGGCAPAPGSLRATLDNLNQSIATVSRLNAVVTVSCNPPPPPSLLKH